MRRKWLFILIDVLIIVMIVVNYEPGRNKRVIDETEEVSEFTDVEYKQIPIVYEQGMDKSVVREVQDAALMMPPEVIESFSEEGWKISLVSEIDLSGTEYENSQSRYTTVGLTDYKAKIIQLRPLKYHGIDDFVKLKALHEMCHYADLHYGNLSETSEWSALYKKYKDSYVEYEFLNIKENKMNRDDIGYATSDRFEFFACSMKDYINENEWFTENYPDVSEYFDQFVKGTSNNVNFEKEGK